MTYFNTSHVTVYLYLGRARKYINEFQYISCYCLSKRTGRRAVLHDISIHLMLLFILLHLLIFSHLSDFNTSHVTVYLVGIDSNFFLVTFQYISCYCLSKEREAGRWRLPHFNTSHVTVYLVVQVPYSRIISFQYISCYCLSGSSVDPESKSGISIHLMLLFISGSNIKPRILENFNTSHVTVYHDSNVEWITRNIISIHLMLLFIAVSSFGTSFPVEFQYISCYCLSPPDHALAYLYASFQYISCYCLSCNPRLFLQNLMISIHLMLLFIFAASDRCFINKLFQYISCYCLSMFRTDSQA